MSELDQFLETSKADESVEQAKADVQDAAVEEAKPDEQAGDKGASDAGTPPAVKDESSATKDASESGSVPLASLLDERRKRQELEKRLEALEKGQQPPTKQEEEEVDIFADPDKFKASIRKEIQQESLKTRITVSQELMREAKPDYAEKEAKFIEMLKADPSLRDKMISSPNPAKFAYEAAQKQILLDEIGDPAAYKAKLKAELLAELKGAQPAAEEKPAKPDIEDTPSLATASAAQSNQAFTPPTLETLFSR